MSAVAGRRPERPPEVLVWGGDWLADAAAELAHLGLRPA